MASQIPPERGVAYGFDIALVSQADTDVFKTTVTLAAGDIQVSLDGGQFANLATFPPAETHLAAGSDSGVLHVELTSGEMTADIVTVLFRDAAGAEWQDAIVTIHTATVQINDLTAQATRDALKLAPSAGAAADGSIDAHLDLMATLSDLATAADLADAVWDEVLSGHSTAGFAGQVATATSTGVSTVNSIVTTVSTGVSTVNSIATKTSAGVSTNTSIVTAVSSYIATNLAAVYGATERACINLLDDASGGLADIQADVVHTMDDVEVALDSLSTISTAVSTVTSIVTTISTAFASGTVNVVTALAGAVLTIRRGDSLSATWTGLASNAGHAKIWLTIKDSQGDADSAAIVQIEHAGGLLYLNGAVASTAANGTLTADSNTQITVTLTATETDDLVPANGLYYDLQMLVGTTTTTLTEGPCNIVGDVTRAVA
jgi:hypothetical protein